MLLLVVYLCILTIWFQVGIAQSSSRELDSLLQDYAFKSILTNPKTGIVFNATSNVASNLTGIQVAALRLRSGSLRRRGFGGFKEFNVPVGLVELPYVERVVLVYHNLGNFSEFYYPLPGYRFFTPVLGLLAYDASDLEAVNLSELDVRVSGEPVSIDFSNVWVEGDRLSRLGTPMCVYFGLDGSVGFDNVVNGSTCLTTNQGHFAIVVEWVVSPAPAPTPSGGEGGGAGGEGGGAGGGSIGGGDGRSSRSEWIIGGSVVGGAALLVCFVLLFGCAKKCRHRKKMRQMEDAAEWGVPLQMTQIGNTKAPVASQTRTRPFLENEFVP